MSFTAPIQLPGLTLDPRWYRRSVFYEVMVRSFVDSNADGSGDLSGLVSKLDYLQWLGIDALWLPPFFRSPLRDGGYDVADYRSILPDFGTLDEFKDLVTKAHERNMRIVIDLPLNHTSDQHEWFQQSRAHPDGPYGDFYVWSDTDDKYPNIRIIFTDTEDSNWAFDPVRRQFFFHRFFSHQPDLNFENPAVHDAIFEVMRFWLDMGVDGFRLDAIPYLYASDEGNGEGEPPTHEFIKKLRAMVDRDYPGRVMIAEANQWPREVAAFFGTEEEPECHMAFDFPLMPRIFYSLRSQQADELVRVLTETTDIPPGAGWGVFLRNHDELTLEMVSEEYRQAMYGWYAYDPRMRANIGIRRRLAPLLDNSRSELELAHALQVDVGRGHVDFRAQHHAAVGVLARAHFAQARERLGGRAVAPGAAAAVLGQRAARGAHFLGALFVDVGVAGGDQILRRQVHGIEVVAGVVQVLGAVGDPAEAQPAHRVEDRIDVLLLFLFRIGVVEAHVADAAVIAREAEVEADGLGVAEVQVAVGLGRKARADFRRIARRARVRRGQGRVCRPRCATHTCRWLSPRRWRCG